MGKKRVLVGYGVDVDAVANWINTCDGSPQNPTNVSRGVFGATVGIDRLLSLFDRYSIRATFFSPAHSIETFPEQMAKVREAGHEIGLHGYTYYLLCYRNAHLRPVLTPVVVRHEYVSQLSEKEQWSVLTRSIEVVEKFWGRKPLGYTAPSWSTSKELIPQLGKAGILYDHSFMHHDVQPYYAPDSSHTWIETNMSKSADAWMKPMSKMRPSKVIEIPANWHLDDWPALQPVITRNGSTGFTDTHVVERLWREQFDFAYREYETFVFPISIHPQVSGKPQVILMHERLIEHINKHEGVEWVPFCEMAKEFQEGRIKGVEIQGGADY